MWIAVWASLCLLATSFALVTFLLDPSVLLYPERCVVFLNLSYFLLSLGYLLRIVLGAEAVSCMTTVSAANKTVSQQNIIYENDVWQCSLLLLSHYFKRVFKQVVSTYTSNWWKLV